MSVYTKTGDQGKTSLYTGERVEKASLRVETYGVVDETNSALGMARAFSRRPQVREKVQQLQSFMPLLMADLASVGKEPMIQEEHIRTLEKEMDAIESSLPPLHSFLIPGNTISGATLDMARTIARRAERCFCRLSDAELTHENDRIFMNRLSDYCFLLMRLEEQEEA